MGWWSQDFVARVQLGVPLSISVFSLERQAPLLPLYLLVQVASLGEPVWAGDPLPSLTLFFKVLFIYF